MNSPEIPQSAVEPLLTSTEIAAAVRGLGRQVNAEYADKQLTLLGVLTGSLLFLADLMRQIDHPLRVGLIQASSYRGTTTRPGPLTINDSLVPDITGRDVLLVDDILDTGHTLQALMTHLRGLKPASLRSSVLLWKPSRTVVDIRPDYHCFEIPDRFVVGYGMDYNDDYRHLPFIGTLD